MRPPPLLIALTLAANAALVAILVTRPTLAPPALQDFFGGGPSAETIAAEARARAVQAQAKADAARRAKSSEDGSSLWPALASDDIRTLIARLRAAGFPPRVIRSVVNARLNTQLKERFFARLGADADQPYWKSDSEMGGYFGGKLWEIYNEAYRERSRLYRDIMHDDFFADADDMPPGLKRNYGNLPRNKIDQIDRINADYSEMSAQIRSATQGVTLAEDREKLALLERERRADLAALLSPDELADYTMRTSSAVSRFRNAFTLMDATEEEFRAVYRLQQAYDEKARAAVNSNAAEAPNPYDPRSAEAAQLQKDFKAALGDQRYADFQRAQNGEFQQLYSFTRREGLPPEVATQVFALRDSTTQASSAIMNDPARTLEQKQEALKALAQTTRAQVLSSLGSTAAQAYFQVANRWLSPLERGQAVTFTAQGAMTVQKAPQTPPP